MGKKLYDIPSNWVWSRLDEVCQPLYYKGVEGSTPYLEIGDIDIVTKKYIFTTKKAVKGSLIAKRGDVLISRVRPTRGAIVVLRESDAHVSSALSILRPKTGILSAYVHYYLAWNKDFAKYLGERCTGTMYPTVSKEVIYEYGIPIAPTNEQELIVAEIEKQFSRLDEALAALKRIQANLKRYKASVLKAAVEGKLTEQWRKEHPDVEPASELLKRILTERQEKWEEKNPGKKYKEPATPDTSNLPVLPKGWVWATLSQLGELNRGKSKHRPRNAPHLYGGPYPFVQTGDIKNATGVIRKYKQTYSEEGFKQSRLWPMGTLCITIAANIADTAILGFDACFPDSIVGFISKSENVDIRFVEYFFRTAKENIERFAPATAQKNINLEILNDIAIPLPLVREQQAIINEIEQRLSVTSEIDIALDINLKRADRLRQSILKKAFSGRLV